MKKVPVYLSRAEIGAVLRCLPRTYYAALGLLDSAGLPAVANDSKIRALWRATKKLEDAERGAANA